jgi:hypothetical protein
MTTAVASPTVERKGADPGLAFKMMFNAPDECKFRDFTSLRKAASEQRKRSLEIEADLRTVLFATTPDDTGAHRDFVWVGDEKLRLTNFFYKQIAFEAGIPLGTLSLLKPDTRVRVLNELWEPKRGMTEPSQRKLLLEKFEDGTVDVRAMNGARYERLWDDEVFAEIDRWLIASGWVPAYPTFNIDPATPIEQRDKALIRTDRYSFTFYFTEPKFKAGEGFSDDQGGRGLNGSADIAKAQGFADPRDTDGLGGLRKGIMVYNGETGHKSFGWQQFLFRNVCSNFNIWDMTEGMTRRARHTASVRDAFAVFKEDVQKLSGELTELELDHLRKAKNVEFAKDDEGAEKRLSYLGVQKRYAKPAVEAAHNDINGGNLSLWSVVNGMTWAAKEFGNEEDRVELCTHAGRVLESVLAE